MKKEKLPVGIIETLPLVAGLCHDASIDQYVLTIGSAFSKLVCLKFYKGRDLGEAIFGVLMRQKCFMLVLPEKSKSFDEDIVKKLIGKKELRILLVNATESAEETAWRMVNLVFTAGKNIDAASDNPKGEV